MSLTQTPSGDRVQIAVFGKRNAGKSSLINALTGQQTAIVSPVKGTTTDPVYKAMEILPLGPCMLIDTPGLDDEGELGEQRIEKTRQVLHRTDIALLVADISLLVQEKEGTQIVRKSGELGKLETELIKELSDRKIPCILVLNQSDQLVEAQIEEVQNKLSETYPQNAICITSAENGSGMEKLKDTLIKQIPQTDSDLHIVGDLVEAGDMVVLVTPIDEAAPKGRIILPQQQVIRDLLDHHAIPVVTQVEELGPILQILSEKVRMVITDSQAFGEVSEIVPEEIPLTSFSILFARHKGNLSTLAKGVGTVEKLQSGDRVLIAEGCTHRRQCGDIGTVKIPNWLREHTGKDLVIETCSARDFPEDLSSYRMVIHCGGCTLPEKEMKHRMERGKACNVPIVNYGIFIAYVKGIFQRSVALFPEQRTVDTN